MIKFEAISRLPSEYQEVEYIQSSGTQYINTLFNPKYNSRVVLDGQITGSAFGFVFGARAVAPSYSNPFNILFDGNNIFRSDYFGTSRVSTTVASHSVRMIYDKNKNVCSVGGSVMTNAALSSGQSSYPLFLFATNEGGSAAYYGSLRLFSCQIYDNGTLVRDLVPCYRKSDSVAGLYDLVNGVFYTNAGSGAFTVGANSNNFVAIAPVITAGGTIIEKMGLRRRMMMISKTSRIPKEYQEVKCIQSSGTQHINTGFKANNNTRVLIDFEYLSGSVVFGAYDMGGSDAYGIQIVNSKWHMYYGTSGATTAITVAAGNRYVLDFNKNILHINETLIRTAAANTFQGDNPLILFALYNVSSVTNYTSLKLYSCQIYDNGTMIRDYIPCYRKADGVVGLYDATNGEFYSNSGSGTFVAGPEV